ncbi:hypothetical protein [Sphingobium tyrosinilyticum]|uniref:Uncharacterized protein n=1 Tax=Sphingobium tyrosinilyticum TaxID=2715436 RepID=A0ABV9EX26_9SPHN
MSIFRNDTLGSWTRGGQATVHNVRMTTQVFKQTTLAGLVLWVMLTVWFVYLSKKMALVFRWQLTGLHQRIRHSGGAVAKMESRTPQAS